MKPVTLAVIGYGWFAELLFDRVLPSLPEIEVVAVCDRAPRRREAAASRGLPVYADIADLLGNSSCEAVAVMTPHDTHRALVEDAVAAGHHVFCEKAMAVTVEDCLAMIRAAQDADRALVVGHMQKLFPPYARVVELARSGIYGRVLAVNVFGFHWCPVFEGWWRKRSSCGGLLYWTGIHDLDTMRAVVGSEAVEVYAAAGPKCEEYTEYEDSIAVTIRYASGALGSIQVAAHEPLREFEESFDMTVLCERGGIRFLPRSRTVEHAGRDGFDRNELQVEQFAEQPAIENAAYREELRHFAAVVRNQEESLLAGEDGLRCVCTLQAVYRSLDTGLPVTVERIAACG